MIRFSIWRDQRTGDYEIVLWKNRQPLVVQTNIRTREKADVALAYWQKIEKETHAPRS